MPELLDHTDVSTAPPFAAFPGTAIPQTSERLARADLRRQIARLERQLGELFASAFPRRGGLEWRVGAVGGPRVLSTGELERVRDALATRLRDTQDELSRQADVEEANRGLLETMIAAPEEHRWVIVSNQDIGESGCRHWHSRPRWGILGMLMGWWRIRLSSGCPLAEGPRPPAIAVTLDSLVAKKRRKPRPRSPAAPAQPAAGSEAPPKPRPVAKTPAPKPRKPIEEERPPAPWGSFPLVELVVLIGLVMLVAAFIVNGPRSTVLLATGLALGSLAGLELSIREHFGGYRSHTILLAAVAGVAVLALLFYAVPDLLPPAGRLAVAGLVTAVAAYMLARAFRARSGRLLKLR